jgi:single-strand DNA-binding protein
MKRKKEKKMALNYNNILEAGNLVADPEIKTTESGKKVCNFRIAVNDKKNAPVFFQCVAWEKTAEFVETWFKKGSPIFVQGRMNQKVYTDKNGEKHYSYEIGVERVYFSGAKSEQAGDPSAATKPEMQEIDPMDDDDFPF